MLARGGVNILPPSSPSPRSGGHDNGGRRNNGGRLDHRDPRNVWDTPPGGDILLRGGGTGGGSGGFGNCKWANSDISLQDIRK